MCVIKTRVCVELTLYLLIGSTLTLQLNAERRRPVLIYSRRRRGGKPEATHRRAHTRTQFRHRMYARVCACERMCVLVCTMRVLGLSCRVFDWALSTDVVCDLRRLLFCVCVWFWSTFVCVIEDVGFKNRHCKKTSWCDAWWQYCTRIINKACSLLVNRALWEFLKIPCSPPLGISSCCWLLHLYQHTITECDRMHRCVRF